MRQMSAVPCQGGLSAVTHLRQEADGPKLRAARVVGCGLAATRRARSGPAEQGRNRGGQLLGVLGAIDRVEAVCCEHHVRVARERLLLFWPGAAPAQRRHLDRGARAVQLCVVLEKTLRGWNISEAYPLSAHGPRGEAGCARPGTEFEHQPRFTHGASHCTVLG